LSKIQVKIPEAFQDLFAPARFKVFYGGRGGAKSWAFAMALLILGLMSCIRVLCARELQKSISQSVHKLLSDLIKNNPIFSAHYEIFESVIRGKNGTEFYFCGLKHNVSGLKSYEGVDYCWVEEGQAVSDNSWEILLPTIRKEGSEIWISFNPKNPTDPTWQKFVNRQRKNSIVRKVGWQDNPFFPKVLNDERLDDLINNPDAYQHIWEGAFDTRYSGAVYAKWVQMANDSGRIRSNIFDRAHKVHTAWDLGFDDSTAIIFWQRIGNECRIVGSYEASQQDIEHYCQVLADRAAAHGYSYGDHYVPHDAANRLLAAGGRSIVEQAYALGVKMRVVAATSQQNQIEALRKVLGVSWFDSDHCADLIHALNSYHFEFDEDRKIFKPTPVHDWSSHYADAAEIIGQVWQIEKSKEKSDKPRFLDKMTADELFWGTDTAVKSHQREF
jgi:phage terminase large subunit